MIDAYNSRTYNRNIMVTLVCDMKDEFLDVQETQRLISDLEDVVSDLKARLDNL